MKEVKITKDNLEEVTKLYEGISKDLKLKFSGYYKYSFSFYGEVGNIKVYVSYGGNADDIYRYDITAEKIINAPLTLEELVNVYFYISIKDTEKDIEYSSYHY